MATPRRNEDPLRIDGAVDVDERRLVRRPANLSAIVSGATTRSHRVKISNVTGLGCGVDGAYHFNVGDRVLLTVDPIGPLPGVVIWRKADRLGFEFAHPLHPAVLAHIERTNPGVPPAIGDRHRTLHEFTR